MEKIVINSQANPLVEPEAKTESQPLVNILIPTYNRANYLRETIQSVLAQTYQNIEILVFDDASPDNTSEVVAEFSHDSRVVYVRHSQNLGMAENWKASIAAATGEFFCLLNDDDTLEPEFVESLAQPLIDNENLILAFCQYWIMNAEGVRLQEATDKNISRWKLDTLAAGDVQNVAHSIVVDRSPYIGATLFRKSLVSADFIDERAKGFADAWLFYQCAKTGFGAYYVRKQLMNYREHGEGMSRTGIWRQYMTEGNLYWYQQMLNDSAVSNIHAAIQADMPSVLTVHGLALLSSGKHVEAREALEKALQTKRSTKTLIVYGLAALGPLGTKTFLTLKQLRDMLPKR